MKTMKKHILFTLLAATLVFGCSPRRPGNINVEQAHNPASQHIIAPGFGTVGLIGDGIIDIYFQGEDLDWQVDEQSRFPIPENNEGVLGMGLGIFGVIMNNTLHFYSMNNQNEWEEEEEMRFNLPRRYDRLTVMGMPWQIGAIGIENDGVVDFHFLDDDTWEKNDAASFVIPADIRAYYPMGEMTIAIADEEKLGLYYFAQDEWDFMDFDPLILILPDDHKAIIPMDNRLIGILFDEKMDFYQLDLPNDRWVNLTGLDFELPH